MFQQSFNNNQQNNFCFTNHKMSSIGFAGEDLLRIIKSKKRYSDTFVKRYWRHLLLKKQQEQLMKQILSVGEKAKQRVHFLKWLVYLHVMMMTRCQHFEQLGDMLAQFITPDRFKKSRDESDEFDKLLQRVTQPYVMYIQKRALKASVVRVSVNKSTPHEELLEVSFELVNLINLGCSFCKEIYKFGRYYSEEYPFLSDLNTILGMDLRQCYATLRSCVSRLWASFKHQHGKTQHILNALIDEINTTNQKLFIVFYNTYFYTELKHFLPTWIRYEPKEVNEQAQSNKQDIIVRTQENSKATQTSCKSPPLKRKNSRMRPDIADMSIKELQQLMESSVKQSKFSGDCSTTAQKTPIIYYDQELEEVEITQFDKTKQHLLAESIQIQI